MIEINLLPEDLKRSAQVRDTGPRTRVLTVVLLMMMAAGVGYFHVAHVGARQAKNRELADRATRLQKDTRELADLERAIKHVEKRKRALASLFEQRLLWGEKLDQLVDIVPANVWFKSLRLSPPRRTTRGSSSGGNLVLECYSAGAEEKGITLFRERLAQHEVFWQDVANINRISHTQVPFPDYIEGMALAFTVDLGLKPREASSAKPPARRTRTARGG